MCILLCPNRYFSGSIFLEIRLSLAAVVNTMMGSSTFMKRVLAAMRVMITASKRETENFRVAKPNNKLPRTECLFDSIKMEIVKGVEVTKGRNCMVPVVLLKQNLRIVFWITEEKPSLKIRMLMQVRNFEIFSILL